jgi:hypothetical protein
VGTLLQQDMDLIGNKSGLRFVKNGTELLHFAPCYPGSSVFCADMSATKLQEVASTLKQEECISHKTMHRRLAHLSNKMLQYAHRHASDFPTIVDSDPTSAPHICKGCEEGKKHKREFIDCGSNQQASHPFKLIHLDVKSFPIESYMCKKYVVTFIDDHSGRAWILTLHQKSQVPHAT